MLLLWSLALLSVNLAADCKTLKADVCYDQGGECTVVDGACKANEFWEREGYCGFKDYNINCDEQKPRGVWHPTPNLNCGTRDKCEVEATCCTTFYTTNQTFCGAHNLTCDSQPGNTTLGVDQTKICGENCNKAVCCEYQDNIIVSNSTGDFIAVLTFAGICFFLFLLIFLTCRCCQHDVYMPNEEEVKTVFHETVEADAEEPAGGVALPDVGIFWNIFSADHDKVLELAGLDAYMFVETMWLCLMILVWMFPVAVLAAIIFSTDPNPGNANDFLRTMSLGNVTEEWRNYIGLLMVLWSSAVMVYKFRSAFMRIAMFVEKHHLNDHQEKYSVLVTRITDQERVTNEIDNMYEKQGFSTVPKKVNDLTPLYDALVAAENLEDRANAGEDVSCCSCICGETTLESVVDARKKAEKEFLGEEANGEKVVENLEGTPTAIVTFPTVRQALECANGMLLPADEKVLTRPCPYRDDILYGNLHASETLKSVLSLISLAVYIAIIIFWTTIITFIQGLTSLESLSKIMPFLEDIANANPAVKSTIQGLLPVIAVSIAFALLPIVLWYLASYTYPVCLTDLKASVLVRYTHCFIGVGLLAASVSGAIMKNVGNFAENLSFKMLYELLGTEVPLVSTYFINIVVNGALFGLTMELSGIVAIILKYVTGIEQPEFVYHLMYPQLIYIFTIVITYCSISPFMILWGFIYFLFAYWVFKHQLMYVYKLKKDTNAWQNWPKIYGLFHIGLYIGQLVVIGVFATKQAWVGVALTFAALCISMGISASSKREFTPYFDFPSLMVADGYDQENGPKKWDENYFYTDAEKRALGMINREEKEKVAVSVDTSEKEMANMPLDTFDTVNKQAEEKEEKRDPDQEQEPQE